MATSRQLQRILARYRNESANPSPPADTIILAGREITVDQKPHMIANAKAARNILTNLLDISPRSPRTPRASKISKEIICE